MAPVHATAWSQAFAFAIFPLVSGFTLPVGLRRAPVGLNDSVVSREASALRVGDVDDIPPTFPLSRRVLVDKAKEIDPSIERGEKKGSYSTVGWSNRVGTVLNPAAVPGVYEAGRPFIWNSIDVGCRMTVIQLQGTTREDSDRPDLFIHSPVGLDDRLVGALEKLGDVKHVVSPNYEHVKYAYQWAERYPDANIWGCPGLAEREPNVRWTGEIPFGTRPPGYPCVVGEGQPPVKPVGPNGEEMWDWEEVQPLHVDCEVNPFTGKAFFNEVVFFHSPSKTLLCTDTYWNYPASGVTNSNYDGVPGQDEDFGVWELAPEVGKIPFGSRMWKVGMDKLFRPFYLNLMVKPDSKDRFRNIAAYISGNGWDVHTIIPAHGDIVRGKQFCRNILTTHFNLND